MKPVSTTHSLVRHNRQLPSPVFEVVDQTWSIPLLRELVEVSTQDGHRLVVLRKRPLDCERISGAVLLLHGLGQNRFSWDLSQRSFANYLVAHGYEVFIADLRGHGLSRAHGAPYPEGFGDYVDLDVPALLRAASLLSQQEEIFVIGHSLGASIAYCLDSPEQRWLRGIVSLAGPGHFARGTWFLRHLATGLHEIGRINPFRGLSPIPFLPVDLAGWLLRRGRFYFDSPLSLFPMALWYPRSIEPEILEERLTLGFDRTSVEILRFMFSWASTGRLEPRKGVDYSSRLQTFTRPILFIVGAQDAVAPSASVEPAYAAAGSADKSFICLDSGPLAKGWGHLDLVCGKAAPAVVWPRILEWLQQH